MKRRETLKYMLVGSVGAATLGAAAGCKNEGTTGNINGMAGDNLYGRTPEEIKHDARVNSEIFLIEHELATIAALCDIILPATSSAGSASDAGVPEFIDFIVKDLPSNQVPIRGGLMWLDSESNKRFNKTFVNCTTQEEMQLVEDIAYPDPENSKPEMRPGISFFNLMRNLTLTGYYTTKMGFEDLGVTSNFPNVWDGVPPEVLAKHGVDYDQDWLDKCIDQSKRNIIAEWDEDGNLLT